MKFRKEEMANNMGTCSSSLVIKEMHRIVKVTPSML